MGQEMVVRAARGNEGGATLLETALFLPFVLLTIFIVIGIAVTLNARESLSNAMTDSLRLAHTRGNSALVGTPIGAVATYKSGGGFPPIESYIATLPGESLAAESFFDACFGATYGQPLRQLPEQYIYTLIYINKSLQQSIGPTLRFPCAVPGGSTPPGCPNLQSAQAGCVGCYLLNPTTNDFSPSSVAPDPDVISLRCEYSPSGLFMRPIVGLFALVGAATGSNPFVIQRDFTFNAARVGL